MWAYLPDILLEDIFSRLSIADRYEASQVCRNWYRIFHSSYVWQDFEFGDRTLTRRKFNYYLGYEHILDHYSMQIFLHRVGRNIKTITILPVANFFNLYEFMTMLSSFCEFFDENPLAPVHTLDFTFACHLASGDSTNDLVFGTGGKLLQALKRLMSNLVGLRHLALRNLLLDSQEAMFLLDDIVQNCCETLRFLMIVNCTKEPYPILHCGVFLKLETLVISPQHLSDDLVILLCQTPLRNLHIVQTKYTEVAYAVGFRVWRECRVVSPKLKVHLAVEGKIKTPIIWQENAPVITVVYNTPYSQLSTETLLMAATLYSVDLESYVYFGLPRFYTPRGFADRPDSALVLLCRSCPNLKTLVIRERVSTETLLLIATQSPSLTNLIVRGNAIIKRCDWPRSPEWSQDFYQWLKCTSQSYERTAEEISRVLGTKWHPLTDKDFKCLKIPGIKSWSV